MFRRNSRKQSHHIHSFAKKDIAKTILVYLGQETDTDIIQGHLAGFYQLRVSPVCMGI